MSPYLYYKTTAYTTSKLKKVRILLEKQAQSKTIAEATDKIKWINVRNIFLQKEKERTHRQSDCMVPTSSQTVYALWRSTPICKGQ